MSDTSGNKPTTLDILLTLRNIEELLMSELERRSPAEHAKVEAALESRENKDPIDMENVIEEIYSQLSYIEDSVHCLVTTNGLKAVEAIAQYRQYFK